MAQQNDVFRGDWELATALKAAGRRALDLVFPPQTLDGGLGVLTAGLSSDVWSRITFLDDPVCDGCGTPFEYELGPEARCAACEAKPRAFARARAACLYDENSRGPILQFKHADRTDLGPLFARWLARSARDLLAEADCVAPVPLHPTRLFRRRYNQAAEIARPLAKMAGLTYLPDALIRRRATETQGGKSGSGRRRNVAAAFEVPPRKAPLVAGRKIVLIDDVMTTGATLEGCARALRKAGAAEVTVAVVSRVKDAAIGPI